MMKACHVIYGSICLAILVCLIVDRSLIYFKQNMNSILDLRKMKRLPSLSVCVDIDFKTNGLTVSEVLNKSAKLTDIISSKAMENFTVSQEFLMDNLKCYKIIRINRYGSSLEIEFSNSKVKVFVHAIDQIPKPSDHFYSLGKCPTSDLKSLHLADKSATVRKFQDCDNSYTDLCVLNCVYERNGYKQLPSHVIRTNATQLSKATIQDSDNQSSLETLDQCINQCQESCNREDYEVQISNAICSNDKPNTIYLESGYFNVINHYYARQTFEDYLKNVLKLCNAVFGFYITYSAKLIIQLFKVDTKNRRKAIKALVTVTVWIFTVYSILKACHKYFAYETRTSMSSFSPNLPTITICALNDSARQLIDKVESQTEIGSELPLHTSPSYEFFGLNCMRYNSPDFKSNVKTLISLNSKPKVDSLLLLNDGRSHDIKTSNLIITSYDYLSYSRQINLNLLSYPYSTNCAHFLQSGFKSRSDCAEQCVKKRLENEFGIRRLDYFTYLTKKEVYESTVKRCEHAYCGRPDCLQENIEFLTRQKLAPNTQDKSLIRLDQSPANFIVNFVPAMTLVDLVNGIITLFCLLFGFNIAWPYRKWDKRRYKYIVDGRQRDPEPLTFNKQMICYFYWILLTINCLFGTFMALVEYLSYSTTSQVRLNTNSFKIDYIGLQVAKSSSLKLNDLIEKLEIRTSLTQSQDITVSETREPLHTLSKQSTNYYSTILEDVITYDLTEIGNFSEQEFNLRSLRYSKFKPLSVSFKSDIQPMGLQFQQFATDISSYCSLSNVANKATVCRLNLFKIRRLPSPYATNCLIDAQPKGECISRCLNDTSPSDCERYCRHRRECQQTDYFIDKSYTMESDKKTIQVEFNQFLYEIDYMPSMTCLDFVIRCLNIMYLWLGLSLFGIADLFDKFCPSITNCGKSNSVAIIPTPADPRTVNGLNRTVVVSSASDIRSQVDAGSENRDRRSSAIAVVEQ